MKRILLSISLVLFSFFGFSQADTVIIISDSVRVVTKKIKSGHQYNSDSVVIISDTISVITKMKIDNVLNDRDFNIKYLLENKLGRISKKPKKKFLTKRWGFDFGFSNYDDNTNYAAAGALGQVGTGVNKDRMEINTSKITNVNLWFFMRTINLIKNVVNLKYGAGLEMNNYRFNDAGISFEKNPTKILYTPLSETKKVKLAVDYFTIPMMINFNLNPKSKNEIGFSAGMSLGYLYSARFKTKREGDVNKIRDDLDLEPFKISYVGEISLLNNFTVYGSYATKNMWKNEFNMTPFTVGLRLIK